MNFKKGEKLVCTGIDNVCKKRGKIVKHPLKGEIVIVRDVAPEDGYISLKGFSYWTYYEPWNFRRLDYEYVEEVLKKIKEERLTESC